MRHGGFWRSGPKERTDEQPSSIRIILPVAGIAWMFAGRCLTAEVIEKNTNIAGTSVQYKVILPKQYDPAKAYPAVLAFGGGPQTMVVVENTIRRNWRDEAARRAPKLLRALPIRSR